MCCREAAGDLLGVPGRFIDGQSSPGDPRFERVTGVIRHRDEELAVPLTGLVDGRDIGVVENAGGARLANEPRARQRVGTHGGRNELQPHPPSELLVLGEVDTTHPLLAERGHHAVVRDARADHRGRLYRSSPPHDLRHRPTCQRASGRRARHASAAHVGLQKHIGVQWTQGLTVARRALMLLPVSRCFSAAIEPGLHNFYPGSEISYENLVSRCARARTVEGRFAAEASLGEPDC